MKHESGIKSLLIRTVIVLAIATITCVAQAKKDEAPGKQQLLAARQAWYDAFCKGDTERMSKIEGEDFLVMSEDGVQSKEEQLKGIQKRVEEKNWLPEGTTSVTDDLKVRLYDNSAVVTGQGWMKSPGQKDAPAEKYLFTEVWINKGREWTTVHLHFHKLEKS